MNYLFTMPPNTIPLNYPPLGVAYVAGALRNTGRRISAINLSIINYLDELLNKIKDENIDVLCVGALSGQYPELKKMISAVRENFSHVKIIIGGGIITAEPEFIIKHLDMDFGCIGYGEDLICEFADCLEANGDFSKIKGLIYKNSSNVLIVNPRRPEPESINDIPYPALDLFGIGGGMGINKKNSLPIIGSRSCPFNCTFCFSPSGYSYKERSLDSIFTEIKYWKNKFEITGVYFVDELFGRSKERVYEFCKRFYELDLELMVQLRVDIVTEKLISVLKNANCKSILYGIESVNQKVLDSMKKNITIQQIENALKLTHQYNIANFSNLIFGDKAETYEMANESLSWSYRNSSYGLFHNFIIAYPGTALYNYGVEIGRIDKLDFLEKGCPVVNLSSMSDREFEKLKRKVDGINSLFGEPVINPRTGIHEDGILMFYGDCPNCDTSNCIRSENFMESATVLSNDCCVKCGSKMRITNHFRDFYDGSDFFDEYDYENKKIAVWGATHKAMFRMLTIKELREAVVVIVDTNYQDCNKNSFMGFTVQSPEVLAAIEFDVLYIGARFFPARKSILDAAKEIIGNQKEVMLLS
jgi:radical SAM superfamily enzyme YgiQ (UPF0313 family)